jgi:sodium/proline symporter
LILLALFWRRTTLSGAVAGMVTGAVTCFVWKFVLSSNVDLVDAHPVFGLYELAPGFVLSLMVTIAVSLVSKKPAQEIIDEFNRVADAAR